MNGILVPVIIGEIRSLKDGSLKLTFETQEIGPEKVGQVYGLRNKIAYVYVSERTITDNEKKIVDSLDPELKGKTPGQRLRAVLYLNWKQNSEGYPDDESYYRAKMEAIINTYKANLQP